MKMIRIAMLSLAVVFYATSALAQHGHSGGAAGGGMGNATGHGSSLADHGNANTSSNGSTHKSTINDILGKNPAIGDKIKSLTGMPASQSCTGFKNLGQCVAAAHVSKNLGVNFFCLRQTMTGTGVPQGTTCPAAATTTGSKTMSLGKAIQTLDPQANSKSESKKAETETQQDLKSSGVKS